jgi:hypothetical protein
MLEIAEVLLRNNTATYGFSPSVMKKKSFITLAPDVNVIKLFCDTYAPDK